MVHFTLKQTRTRISLQDCFKMYFDLPDNFPLQNVSLFCRLNWHFVRVVSVKNHKNTGKSIEKVLIDIPFEFSVQLSGEASWDRGQGSISAECFAAHRIVLVFPRYFNETTANCHSTVRCHVSERRKSSGSLDTHEQRRISWLWRHRHKRSSVSSRRIWATYNQLKVCYASVFID